MAGPSVNTKEVTDFLKLNTDTSNARAANALEQGSTERDTAGLFTTLAGAQNIVMTEQARIASAQNEAKVKAMTAAGADLYTATARQAVDAHGKVLENLLNLQETENKSFGGDVLGWLKNKIWDVPEAEKKLRDSASVAAITQQSVNNAYVAITHAGQVAAETVSTTSVAGQQAAAEATLTQAKINANAARLRGLAHDSEALLIAQHAGKDALATMFQFSSFQLSQESAEMSRKRFAAELEQQAWMREQRAESQAAKKLTEATDNEGLAIYNQGRAIGGLAPVDINGFRMARAKHLSGGDPGFLSTIRAGYAANNGSLQYFDGFAGMLDYLESNPGSSRQGKAGKVQELLYATARTVDERLAKDPTYAGMDDKKKASYRNGKINEEMGKTIEGHLARPTDPNSLAYLGPLNSYMDSPEVQSTPIFQKVLKPVMASGQLLLPENLMALTLAKVNAKEITTGEAQGLADVMRAAYAQHLTQLGLAATGYKPKQGTVKFSVRSSVYDPGALKLFTGSDYSNTSVDLLDPVSIVNTLARYQVGRSRQSASSPADWTNQGKK